MPNLIIRMQGDNVFQASPIKHSTMILGNNRIEIIFDRGLV